MSLPPPSDGQAFCSVSALDVGDLNTPLAWILADANADDYFVAPALSFLIRHPADDDTIVFDLDGSVSAIKFSARGIQRAAQRLRY